MAPMDSTVTLTCKTSSMSITPSGFTTKVAGRTVTVRAGTKSQTVNICTPRQVVGDYEAIYRLPIQSAIEDPGEIPELATLAEFKKWLAERNGAPEGSSTARGETGGLSPLVSAPINDAWVGDAVPLVEDAIDSLVDTFVSAPYLHRVEHSFHAELISELRKHEKLRACVEIGTSGLTQLIHKEWPETVVRGDRGKTVERRGLFDIVVLAPVQFKEATLEQFLQGRIEPPIAIEVGLDYGLKHLDGDIDKLRTSQVQNPYLIHLSRIGPRDKAVEDRINEIAASAAPLRVAYVHHGPGGVAVKRLNDSAVSPQFASPDPHC
jgi:hypothetical protein